MILKELDPFSSKDPLFRAGRKAEETLAHYLQRAFGSDSEILVLNGLRLEVDGDAGQMDHLVVHRYGIIVVESKSVTGKVEVNEREEWIRHSGGREQGMASPVLQAQRQLDFLHRFLRSHEERLRGKMLFGMRQTTFRCMERDVLVAISDGSIFQPQPGVKIPEVCKADQVPARIREIVERPRKAQSLFNPSFSEGGWSFTPEEQLRTARFLVVQHRPFFTPDSPLPPPPPAREGGLRKASRPVSTATFAPAPDSGPPGAAPVCRTCGAGRLQVLWGRYGYYFKCGDCDGNTPIRESCSGCGAPAKLRKDRQRFSVVCAGCGESRLFHVNGAAEA